MTSAAKLFDNRRYRFDRNPSELFDSSDRFSRRHNYRRQRHHLADGCDPNNLRRTTNQLSRSSLPKRESFRLDQGSSSGGGQALSGNVNVENLNRTIGDRSCGNERLPGAVLLARERLLERLRGVSLLEHRRISRASSSTPNNFTLPYNLLDSEESGLPAIVSSSTSSYLLIDHSRLHESRNHPPGLDQDALDCLRIEIFTNAEISYDGDISRASEECSICLDSFVDGAELICLPCKHRFHSSCLNPWVRTCGDCPYCRTGIVVTGDFS